MTQLKDFDVWYEKCKCGYDTAKASKNSPASCWKCGSRLKRDYSNRALKTNALKIAWTVEDREKAINPCNFKKQGNENQCLNCDNGKDSDAYMAITCFVWCVDVAYDEICYKHKSA
jgi:hypothetical protein